MGNLFDEMADSPAIAPRVGHCCGSLSPKLILRFREHLGTRCYCFRECGICVIDLDREKARAQLPIWTCQGVMFWCFSGNINKGFTDLELSMV